MTTIPTIDQISGNTVMQKFRNLAKTVLDVLRQFGDRTDYLIEDLTPRLEQTLIESIKINNILSPMVDDLVTKSQPSVITALITLTNGLSVTGTTRIDGNVQITNGHSLSVASDLDIAGDMNIVGNAIIHGDTEIGGMSVEESNNKTILSNDNGISFTSDVTVPDTTVSSRNNNAVNGTRLQNDLDNYPFMVRDSGNQTINGIKTFTSDPVFEKNWPTIRIRDAKYKITDDLESEYNYGLLLVSDNENTTLSQLCTRGYPDGKNRMYMEMRDRSGTKSGNISLYSLTDGLFYATAPTTPSTATSNEIATADWVISKINELAKANNLQVIQ